MNALTLLLTRLHVIGFFWGDVSLSNTLFRRDAGAFAAYLVDAETGKLYEGGLSNGQRENDLEIGRVNIASQWIDTLLRLNTAMSNIGGSSISPNRPCGAISSATSLK